MHTTAVAFVQVPVVVSPPVDILQPQAYACPVPEPDAMVMNPVGIVGTVVVLPSYAQTRIRSPAVVLVRVALAAVAETF